MKKSKILILLSIISISILIFLTKIDNEIISGKINNIQYSNKKITIFIENQDYEIIIFDSNIINLKKEDKIKFIGKKEKYNGKDQIIINKIWKENV